MRMWAAMVLAMTVLAAPVPELGAAGAAEPARPTFDTRADPLFGDATGALMTYLDSREVWRGGPQHFCVVGYRHWTGERTAEVHWVEGKRLILWEPAADRDFARSAIRDSRRDLDLTKDVVPTRAGLMGSTYRVTQGWLDRTLADCAAKGASYTIKR